MRLVLTLCAALGLLFHAGDANAAPPTQWPSTSPAPRPPAMRGGGWGPGGGYGRLYDPATVRTLRGQVVRVERVSPMKGMSEGVHLIVRGESGGTIPVHLGPAWFIEKQELSIKRGDRIEVTGSRVIFNRAPALIARTVAKGDDELVLRDEAGVPVWSAARRRGARPPPQPSSMIPSSEP